MKPPDAWDDVFKNAPDLMTIKEASRCTRMSEGYLRQLARTGRIPATRIGGRRWYIPRAQFVEWLKEGGSDAGRKRA